MIPRSMWRQFANSSAARDKEKESKRWALGKIEERNRPTPLPRACPPCRGNKQRRMQIAPSNQGTLRFIAQNSKPIQDQSCGKSTRSSISQNQICVLNLYSVYFLFTCHVYLLFVYLLVFGVSICLKH
ncbi:hypothetical protein ACFXTH_000935 [Malus domestica]